MAGPLQSDIEVHIVAVLLSSENADEGKVKLKKTPSVALRAIRDRATTESLRATALLALKMVVARPGIADLVVEGCKGRPEDAEVDEDGAGEGCCAATNGPQRKLASRSNKDKP